MSKLSEVVEYWEKNPEHMEAWILYCENHHMSEFDLPGDTDFEESYQGEYESFESFARQLADDLGDVPDGLAGRYFDYAAYAADLIHDYWHEDLPSGRVAVFRDM